LLPNCGLKQLLGLAGDAYLQVLDAATLADVLSDTVTTLKLPQKETSDNLK